MSNTSQQRQDRESIMLHQMHQENQVLAGQFGALTVSAVSDRVSAVSAAAERQRQASCRRNDYLTPRWRGTDNRSPSPTSVVLALPCFDPDGSSGYCSAERRPPRYLDLLDIAPAAPLSSLDALNLPLLTPDTQAHQGEQFSFDSEPPQVRLAPRYDRMDY